MLQKDKELLLKDLCGRLPYGVIIQHKSQEKKYNVVLSYGNISYVSQLGEGWWSECKPYLRPMSSMTEDEIIEFNNISSTKNYKIIENDLPWDVAHYKQIEWLNKKMFDYRGLIPKGLAISTDKYNPYKD